MYIFQLIYIYSTKDFVFLLNEKLYNLFKYMYSIYKKRFSPMSIVTLHTVDSRFPRYFFVSITLTVAALFERRLYIMDSPGQGFYDHFRT